MSESTYTMRKLLLITLITATIIPPTLAQAGTAKSCESTIYGGLSCKFDGYDCITFPSWGGAWRCYSDDFAWGTDCPSCGKPGVPAPSSKGQ